MRFQRRIDAIAIGLVSVVTLAGFALWPRLPAELAIHWSGGAPDNYVAKPLALGGIWALAVGSVVFIRLAPPRLRRTPGGPNVSVLFIGAVIAWIQATVIVWNLGYHFNVWLTVVPVVIAAGALVIYAGRS